MVPVKGTMPQTRSEADMTENEMTVEMGSVVQELAEVRKRRTCLETRAERMMANLRRASFRSKMR